MHKPLNLVPILVPCIIDIYATYMIIKGIITMSNDGYR